MDKLIEVQRRNIDALGRSAQVATEGAKSLADKQREVVETAFREASAMVRDFKPTGNPQEMLVKQTEFAKKAWATAGKQESGPGPCLAGARG